MVGPVNKATLTRMFRSDKACGIWYDEDDVSKLPDGSDMAYCHNCAYYVIERLGRGEVWGFSTDDMRRAVPGYNYQPVCDVDGHDFAVVDKRYIVDLWVSLFTGEEKQIVYDMQAPGDKTRIRQIYGDPKVWKKISSDRRYPARVYRNPTGATTAIARTSPPEPLKWLWDKGLIVGRALDYGSGRGCWFGMTCYDPHWRPGYPTGKYATITCIYVLNVVPPKSEFKIIKDIKDLLKLGGIAYFAVRRDLPREGKAGRDVWQRWVELPMELISENKTRAIYAMRRVR